MKIKETNLSVFNKQSWEKANRQLLAKMLQEFMYENIIEPKQLQKQGRLPRIDGKTTEALRIHIKRNSDCLTVFLYCQKVLS